MSQYHILPWRKYSNYVLVSVFTKKGDYGLTSVCFSVLIFHHIYPHINQWGGVPGCHWLFIPRPSSCQYYFPLCLFRTLLELDKSSGDSRVSRIKRSTILSYSQSKAELINLCSILVQYFTLVFHTLFLSYILSWPGPYPLWQWMSVILWSYPGAQFQKYILLILIE